MSVERKNVIDFVGIKDEKVVLTISDHLEWDEENEHLLILQDKINCYLGAIETGELYEIYPNAKNRSIIIQIIALHEPNKDGITFLERTAEILNASGYAFYFTSSLLTKD